MAFIISWPNESESNESLNSLTKCLLRLSAGLTSSAPEIERNKDESSNTAATDRLIIFCECKIRLLVLLFEARSSDLRVRASALEFLIPGRNSMTKLTSASSNAHLA